MLYVIEDKYYILTNGYYKEVEVVKNPKVKDDFIVKYVSKGKQIEASKEDIYPQVNYKEVAKKSSKTEIFG